jgi:UDP-N-acetylmuramate dehydrogenase
LHSVEYVDETGALYQLNRNELNFAYRFSSFQKMKGAIVGATFKLLPSSSARQKQLEIISQRKKSQPLSEKSAGCVFRNPTGSFAGKLIEEAQLKGISIGGAQVSPVHANFIVNTGTATAKDLLSLIEKVRQQVKDNSGYDLHHEIRIIPFKTCQGSL